LELVLIQKGTILQIILVLGLLVTLFPPGGIAQGADIPLYDTIDSGDVSATFSSTGFASGHIADLSITSNAGSDITLDLDNSGLFGMVMANSNTGEQDEVITDTPGVYTGPSSYDSSDTVTLAPGESARIPVVGYCLNFDLATPSPNVGFDLQPTSTKTDINDISNTLDTLDGYLFPVGTSQSSVTDTTQMAIWTSQPENADTPLQEYEDRGYSLSDSEFDTLVDILEQSDVDTDNVVAITGETSISDDGPLGFPWGYPWGYPWGLPFGGLPCYTFLAPLIFVILIVLLRLAWKGWRKPKTKKPGTAPGRTYYAKTRGPVIITPTKPRNCDKLIEKCKEAEKAAEKAELEAKEAMKKANDSYFDFKEAGEAANDAQEELRELKEKPPDEGAWVEMDGTRITSHDLKLRKDASKGLWDRYRAGDIDAQTLEKKWKDLGENEALEELRQMDQKAKHEKARKAVDVAKDRLAEAEINLGEAKKAANNAKSKAAKAKELADKLCKEADDCVKRAKAEAAKVAAAPPAKVTGKVAGAEGAEVEVEAPDDDTEETTETTDTTKETEETTETIEETEEELDKKKKGKKKGKTDDESSAAGGGRARTDYFGPRFGEDGLKPS
jgi:uncharacterized membrane protein